LAIDLRIADVDSGGYTQVTSGYVSAQTPIKSNAFIRESGTETVISISYSGAEGFVEKLFDIRIDVLRPVLGVDINV
jgi:hypothetical protein